MIGNGQEWTKMDENREIPKQIPHWTNKDKNEQKGLSQKPFNGCKETMM
jgi:hypothetical protein